MRWRPVGSLVCALALISCGAAPDVKYSESGGSGANLMTKELIVLATPPSSDAYYSDKFDDIFKFHIAYVTQAKDSDDIVVLASEDHYHKYVNALGIDHVVKSEMGDIWMRDFSLSNAVRPVMFRYTSEGQGGGRKGQKESDFVQETLAGFIEKAGLSFAESDLLNDGGNFVDDYAGNVVLSRKFLRDNNLAEGEGRAAIRKLTGAQNVAFIEADEQGGLEHSDGVVAFVKENTLVINSYPEDPDYAASLKADLKKGLPDVTIHEMITPYDGSKVYDERFGSACGLYTNMLVTPKRIYFPQFGIPEDQHALRQIREWTDREVIPVQSSQVCQMGGGVRCMSWQLRGENAKSLLNYARTNR